MISIKLSVDLHELKPNLWYLHIIDELTKYSNAVLINKKSISGIAFLKGWVSLFGPPDRVFSDNGGEFISDEFYELCEMFNIKVSTSPAYSPWSNGLCERHIQTLSNMVLKIKEDVSHCDWATALSWAICAKNSLMNSNGYSPAQLVFGRNVNFPSVLTNKHPALEDAEKCTSRSVGLHISALHAARQSYICAENSDKIKRALRKQTRPSGTLYERGDNVYYKRDNSPRWCGPARVLGQDGPLVFLRHGTRYIRAHICRTQPENCQEMPEKSQEMTIPVQNDEAATAVHPPESGNLLPNEGASSESESENENSGTQNSATIRDTVSSSVSNLSENVSVSKLKKDQLVSFYPSATTSENLLCKAVILGNAGKNLAQIRTGITLST